MSRNTRGEIMNKKEDKERECEKRWEGRGIVEKNFEQGERRGQESNRKTEKNGKEWHVQMEET